MRRHLTKVGIVLLSVFFSLFLSELIIFRFIFVPSDIPRNEFRNGIICYRPNQKGVYRIKNEVAAEYRINAQGWNSSYPNYSVTKSPKKFRIAIIGDSYVEGLQVPYDRSLAEELEKDLGSQRTETLRFGISGAPLSQYLYMLEKEVLSYSPDCVIIVLIHNDFDESFLFKKGRYTSSFMKVKLDQGKVTAEIPPQKYVETWKDALRQTAFFRYFYFREHMRFDFFSETPSKNPITSNSSSANEIQIVTEYLFRRIQSTCKNKNIPLLMVMDGIRKPIEQNKEPDPSQLFLNKISSQIAQQNNIPFIDLQSSFKKDWNEYHIPFGFSTDDHWNERTHALVAREISDFLTHHSIIH
jgi:lysophospholipase L1-like esterase